jgi:ubiquinone/menaquinone biosynthesis C-methylase UbiE
MRLELYREGIGQWSRRVWRAVRRRAATEIEDVSKGYDLWSESYDQDTDNLLVLLDESVFAELLERVSIQGRRVVDVGCGTGRHWVRMLAREPAELVGYDVSSGMLEKLARKHPGAKAHCTRGPALGRTPTETCDLVVSTLALSHIESAAAAFDEWARVLRPGGEVLLTDVHPAVAVRARTTFRSHERTFSIRRYLRPLETLRAAAVGSGFEIVTLQEIPLSELAPGSLSERTHARAMFEKMKGLAFLYAMHLRKGPRGDDELRRSG